MSKHKFAYRWNLADGYPAPGIDYHGKKVFGTFVCGGGSTMGYKLAGYEHLGGVEIDPEVASVYKVNHTPKLFFQEDIRLFNQRQDLPAKLYNLDLLDGSPPCSSFSMAGNRDKDWGKEKQFREGQAMQRLDDLVFEYVKTIKKLQPKTALLENVKGLIQGNAKVYAKNLKTAFEDAGYNVQVFLLNAASMGVPQKRERVFFIGHRKDFELPRLVMEFKEKAIPFGLIDEGISVNRKPIRDGIIDYAEICPMGKSISSVHPKGHYFGTYKQHPQKVSNTLIADNGGGIHLHSSGKGYLTDKEYCQIGTFPLDYNFQKVDVKYLIGMSVPPVMTAQIAHQIYLQWLSKIP